MASLEDLSSARLASGRAATTGELRMTYGGGPSQAPGHGQAPGEGRRSGAWTAPGQENENSNAIWWILGIVCAVGLIIVAAGAIALAGVVEQFMKSGLGPNSAPATSSSFTPAARPTSSAPAARPHSAEGPASPSIRVSPRFPQVQPAAEMPREDAAELGVEVDIQTSELRYVVMDMFDEPIYNCIFSADFQNLTDQPLVVTVAFRTTGDPQMEWAGGSPKRLEPNDSTKLALGWDGLSPAEVGLSENECTGGVELTELVVAPG